VGGNTSGSVTNADHHTLDRDRVRANHQATGVPSSNSTKVLTDAN
jgi:hypothetical protein